MRLSRDPVVLLVFIEKSSYRMQRLPLLYPSKPAVEFRTRIAQSSRFPVAPSSWARTMPAAFPLMAKVRFVQCRSQPSRSTPSRSPTRISPPSSSQPTTAPRLNSSAGRSSSGLIFQRARFGALVEDTAAHTPWWCKVPGATWNRPEGPGSGIEDRLNHPVVHVSWNDALAYSAWASKQLPTEAQWEYAARAGLEQKLYSWGDDLTPEGEHRCNIWQGQFPVEDTAADGFAGSCPVDAFPPNGYGIYSATGNVWEWCADWFHTDFSLRSTLHDPSGPDTGLTKVMKGESFLCHASYCNRYRVAARTSNTPDSSASNIGFRCARRNSEA
jgi:hypothetical protein